MLAAELTELLERPRRGEARPPRSAMRGGKHEGGLVEVGADGLVDEAARPARRPGAVALGLPLEEDEADRERVVELEPAGLERQRTYDERARAVVERTAEPGVSAALGGHGNVCSHACSWPGGREGPPGRPPYLGLLAGPSQELDLVAACIEEIGLAVVTDPERTIRPSTPSVHRPPMQPAAIGGAPVRVERRRSDVAGNASVKTFAPTAAAQHPSAFQASRTGDVAGSR